MEQFGRWRGKWIIVAAIIAGSGETGLKLRSDLLAKVRGVLSRSEFTYCEIRGHADSNFDTVARRDQDLVLVRALLRRSDLDREGAKNIKVLSSVLRAAPILVMPSRSEGELSDGVLYLRYGIPMMTFNTLRDHLVEEVPPLIFHGPGGFYVSIDGQAMRDRRESLGYSLGALAEVIGVSRKAIQMYEAGMGSSVDIGIKLEEILTEPLIKPLDPFSYSDNLQQIRDSLDGLDSIKREVFDHLDSIGMEVIPTMSCPFDALTITRRDRLLTSVEGAKEMVRNRIEILSDISRITNNSSVLIVTGRSRYRNIKGTPVIGMKEVKKARDPKELLEMIRERSD